MIQRVPNALLLASLLLTLGVGVFPAAHADSDNTLQDELRAFTDEIAKQCISVKEQLEDFRVKADPLTGYNLKDAVQSLCVCLPARTQEFRDTLSPEELERPVTGAEFLGRFNPAVLDKCAAEQMQAMYGEECRKRFRKAGLDVAKYCSCMHEVVRQYPEATAAEIANAAAEYLPMAAEAEKNGQPIPPRPPNLESYYQADQGCKAKR